MIYGYCRISTKKQSIDRQIRNIKREFPTAIILTEAFTGTKLDRPEWNKLNRKLKYGDTIVFDEVSRMSRNAKEGFALYQRLFNIGINLVFLKEPHMNTDSYKEAMQGIFNTEIQSGDKATDDLVNSIMAAVNKFMMNKVEKDIYKAFEQAQKEVDYLHQRTKEGIETARLNGKQIGLEKGTKLTTKKSLVAKEVIKKHNKDFGGSLSNEDTWKLAGISKMTFYKYKNELLADLY
jgi:DNA invertase Pin-like site-specific DNA recombinase